MNAIRSDIVNENILNHIHNNISSNFTILSKRANLSEFKNETFHLYSICEMNSLSKKSCFFLPVYITRGDKFFCSFAIFFKLLHNFKISLYYP